MELVKIEQTILDSLPTIGVKAKLDLNTIKLIMARNPEIQIPYFVELCHLAQKTGADLTTKELMITPRKTKQKDNRGVENWVTVGVPVFSYNFMLKRAQESGQYKGFKVIHGVDEKFELKVELIEDRHKKGEMIQTVLPELSDKSRKVPFCEATVIRDGKYDVTVKVFLDECLDARSPHWVKNWRLMLEKTAVSRAARIQFPEWLGGMYAEEEISEAEESATFKIQDGAAIVTHVAVEKSKELALEKLSEETSGHRGNLLISIEKELSGLCSGLQAQAKVEVVRDITGGSWKDLSKKTIAELESILQEAKTANISRAMKEISKDIN